jgi:hypothetical protein
MPLFDRKSKALVLAREVREVFPDPGWPADRRVSDGPRGDLDVDYVDEHFMGKRWQEITDEELGWTAQDSWALSDCGLAYFLPAYIVCYLEERSPGASDFGDMYLEYWLLNRFMPLLSNGFSREQAELILKIWQHITQDWGDDDEYSRHNYVRQLLELELAERPSS